ncbi:MAG: T9SS type A sorting domain-containing protein [Bacteroidales bacterium]
MKRNIYFIIAVQLIISIFSQNIYSQVTTNGGSGLASTYTSLANAISALNAATITSPVVITLAANETAPAGGFSITQTGGTAINTIIIQGSSSIITAFSPQTSGSLNDAIFKIIGGDYITIQGFVMKENTANNTIAVAANNMTEWGVALLYASLTNGSKNNIIQNNTISLNRSYFNSFGIYSNTRHNATAVTTLAEVTNSGGSNSFNKIYGNSISNVNFGVVFIGAGTTIAAIDNGNDIGGNSLSTGNTISNWGGGSALSAYLSLTASNYCIFSNQQINDNISFNTITSASGLALLTSTFGGILKNYSVAQPTGTFTSNINNNTVTLVNAPSSGGMIGINNQGLASLITATVNINNNTVLNCSINGSNATSAGLTAITNLSACGILNMNNNIIRGNSSTATTGGFTGISNSGAIVSSCNIDNNQIGNGSGNAITLIAPTTNQVVGILNSGGAATCVHSISNNNFQGFTYNTPGSGIFRCINQQAVVSSSSINSNNFNNLTINNSASQSGFLIYASSATPNVSINGNYISTQFSNINPTGNSNNIAIYNAGLPVSGNSNITNNIFSNINFKTTTSYAAVIYWNPGNTPGCNHNSIITGNTIAYISNTGVGSTAGQKADLYGILTSYGNANIISNNNIYNLNAAGGNAIGIYGGNASTNANSSITISNNNIHNIRTTSNFDTIAGAGGAQGILIQSGCSVINILKNKIYDISCEASSAGTSYGIWISQTNSLNVTNIYNNYIGKIYSENSTYIQAVIGISLSNSVGNTSNFYYNTIYLDGNCDGSSYCFYKSSTTSNANLRNNIFINHVMATGGREQLVYFFSGTLSNSYLTSSNNNLLFTNTSDTLNLFYADGTVNALTNKKNSIASFKTLVGPGRENSSVTENISFLNSSTGSGNDYLHIDTSVTTLAESGAVNIAGFTDDYDGDIRQGNTAYNGIGTAPDIGADEFNAIPQDFSAPIISYSPLANTSSLSDRILVATITDISGVGSGANQPVLYWKKNALSYTGPIAPISIAANVYTFSFGGGVSINDVVSYFIVAQDANLTPNIGSYPYGAIVTANPPIATSGPSNPSTYNIGSICGTKTVGVGGNYTTLTAAIADFNSKEITCPVVFSLLDSNYPSETFPIIINSNPGSSISNTLTIKPATGVTVSFSGAMSSGALIKILNNNTIIDGSNTIGGTSRNLSFTNTSTTSPQVLTINSIGTIAVNGVSIKNCNIINGSNASSALVISDNSGTAGYFNNITIQNNSIQKAYIGIYAIAGISSGNGSGLLINGNDLNTAGTNSIRLVGIYVQGVDGATVSNNMIANIVNANAESPRGIWFATASNSGTISGNTISNLSQTNTGAYSITGIYVAPGNSATGINITNNTINSLSNAGSGASFSGIFTLSPNTNVTNNNISNLIQTGNYAFWGILQNSAINSSCSGNTVSGITTTSFGVPNGIRIQGGSKVLSISKNKISNIKNSNSIGYSAVGLALSSDSTNANITVSNNFIYDIASYGFESIKSDNAYGINIYTGGGYKLYFNSVNLGTNQVSSGIPACLKIDSLVTLNSLDVRNNIFSIPATTGSNRCAVICNNPLVFSAINYNDYYSSGSNIAHNGSSFISDLATWKSTTNKDTNSVSGNPKFVSDTNLHIQSAVISPVNNAGITISTITTDIDGELRYSTPDIGADEYTFSPLPVADATAISATTVSSSQINLSFSPNSNNNNVIITWNLSGIFTSPSGTPPAIGNAFAGGLLLSNGITSPVNHSLLSSATTYYYKVFSYDGISYSPGVVKSSTTLCANPTQFAISGITTSSISISWTQASAIQIDYGSVGHNSGSGTLISGISSSPFTLGGLTASTSYDVFIRQNCGNSFSAWVGPITITTLCPIPTSLSVSGITADSAMIGWNAANNIEIDFGTTGHTAGSGTIITGISSSNSYKLGGLTAGSMYDLYIRQYCNPGSYSAWTGPVSFTTICPVPSSLNTISIATDNAKVGWTGLATDFELEYGVSPYSFSGIATKTGITSNSYTMIGLNPATTYQYKVKAICNSGNVSTWSSQGEFTTASIAIPGLWTGTVSTDWQVPGNWSDSLVPVSNVNVVIPASAINQPHITSSIVNPAICMNLTINSGAVLTIDAGKALTVGGTITNYSGTTGLILKSGINGSGSLLHSTNSINATVERYIPHNNTDEFHMLASPVAEQTIAPEFNETDGFYCWNLTNSSWVEYGDTTNFITTNGSLNFIPGKAYAVSYPASTIKNFAGLLNQGSINIPLIYNPGIYAGWNFVGNPYPSSINWDAASGWSRFDLDDAGGGENAIWIWNASIGNYGVYISNAGAGNGTNEVSSRIAIAQGFWVKSLMSGSLGMNNDVRIHSDQTYLKNSTTSDYLRLTVNSSVNSFSDEILIKYGSGNMLSGAEKMFSLNPEAPGLYTIKNNKNWSINHLTSIDNNSLIPVGFKAGADGNYTISANGVQNFGNVLLEDLKTGISQYLTINNDYSFYGLITDNPNRFLLHFSPNKVNEVIAKIPSIGYNNHIINAFNPWNKKTKLSVYDINGRLIQSYGAIEGNGYYNFIPSNGVYIIKMTNEKEVFVKKVVVY